jgi:hypothetical protein
MAGADSESVTLGIDFSRQDKKLMNTLLIARPAETNRDEIETGLVVETSPESDRP